MRLVLTPDTTTYEAGKSTLQETQDRVRARYGAIAKQVSVRKPTACAVEK